MQSQSLLQRQHVFQNQLQKFKQMHEQELKLENPVTLLVRITPRFLVSKYVYWAMLIQGKVNSFGWGSFNKMTKEVEIRGMCRLNGEGLKAYNRRIRDQGFMVLSTGVNMKDTLKKYVAGTHNFGYAMNALAKKSGHDTQFTKENVFHSTHLKEVDHKMKKTLPHPDLGHIILNDAVAHILEHIKRNKSFQQRIEKYCVSPEECQIRPAKERSRHKWSPREFNEYLACGQWVYGTSMFEEDDQDTDDKYFDTDDALMSDEESIL